MIANSGVTIYHKGFDKQTRLETWTRFNYENVWLFGGKGASINKGYDDANDVEVRISYKDHELDIRNFAVGDIIVPLILDLDISRQQDLNNYDIYNITSINNNDFGLNPHIHLGGK